MVTPEDLAQHVRRTPHNAGREGVVWLRDELAGLAATPEEIVAAAVDGMGSDDHNVRVKMLRVLAVMEGERASAAVLAGLHDPVRRVRRAAISASNPHHLSVDVVARLRAVVDDETEVGGIRRDAFFALSSGVARDGVPDVAREAIVGLMDSTRFREPVLVRLCQTADHSAASRAILAEYVESGTKNEAVMATRALCGYMLVRVDGRLPNDVRRRVRETFDAAPEVFGVPSCWIPRDDALALAAELSYPYRS